MSKIIKLFLLLGFFHLAYGLFASFWRPEVFPTIINPATNRQFYDYSGVINVHTTASSGSGTLEEIVSAAQKTSLKFIVLTDLNNFEPKLDLTGYRGDLFLFAGGEYSFLDSRILNFNFYSTEHLQSPGRAHVAFSDILSAEESNEDAGIFIVAHPLKKGYQLKSEYPPGLTGIEILNLKNIWQDTWLNSKISFFWTLFVYPFNADLAFTRMLAEAYHAEFSLWDKLNREQKVYGFTGADAEAKLKLWGNSFIRFPSYETLFSISRNHILLRSELTGNVEQDRKKITDALKNGQFYTSIDILQDPTGFESYAQDEKGFLAPLGSEIRLKQNLELVVRLPEKPLIPYQVLIFKNGEKILTSTSVLTTLAIHSPGVYRSVVRLKVPLFIPDGRKWLNWIVTNPIYVKPDQTTQAASALE